MVEVLLHERLRPKTLFGYLFFADAPFLNNSLVLVDHNLSDIRSIYAAEYLVYISSVNPWRR
jgi:hypothetical protein